MSYTFAVLARAVTLLITSVGSWLFTFANWKGWWSMSSNTQFSGVRRASKPTFVNVCMMFLYMSLYLCNAAIGEEFDAGYEAGIVGGKEDDHFGDLVRLP